MTWHNLYIRKILWLLALERLEDVKKRNQRDCCKRRDHSQHSFLGNVNIKIRPDSSYIFKKDWQDLMGDGQRKKSRERERQNVKKQIRYPWDQINLLEVCLKFNPELPSSHNNAELTINYWIYRVYNMKPAFEKNSYSW